MRKTLFILLTLFLTIKGYSYQDVISTYSFENVKIRLKTGQSFIEIQNKAIILGQLALLTAKERKYKNEIIFDIVHDYSKQDSAKEYIGFSNIDISLKSDFSKLNVKKKYLIIYLIARNIEYDKVIQILDNSILNIDFIIANQIEKQIGNSNIFALDNENLNRINVKSRITDKILSCKLDRVIDDNQNYTSYSTSYFFKDNKYHLYGLSLNNHKNRNDTVVVATISNIFQFERLNYSWIIVFDSDTSFYFLNNSYQNGPTISQRHTISKTFSNYMPFNVTQVSEYIFISFSVHTNELGNQPKRRLLAYQPETDNLIQDAIKLLDE